MLERGEKQLGNRERKEGSNRDRSNLAITEREKGRKHQREKQLRNRERRKEITEREGRKLATERKT